MGDQTGPRPRGPAAGRGDDVAGPSGTVRVRIDAMAPDGSGVARTAGGTVRVAGVLPGEVVDVAVGARPGDRHGHLTRVVAPSPHRVIPACVHAAECGGCGWQHIAYPEQLRLKRRLVRDWLEGAMGREAPEVAETIATDGPIVDGQGAPWGFRHKVHFVFDAGPGGRGVVMGHYRRGSRRVVAVTECPVHTAAGNATAFAMRDALAALGVLGTGRDLAAGIARHVVVRVSASTGERIAVLVVAREDRRVRALAQRLTMPAAAPDGLHVNLHPRGGPWLFGRDTRCLHGTLRLREAVGGVSFLVSPTTFFQTNLGAAATLVRVVDDAVSAAGARSVADLHAGCGLFALSLAAAGRRVVAVEEHAAAIDDGRASQALNGIPPERCRFVRARAERFLSRATRSAFPDVPTEAVVIDPPRDGCPPGLLARILERWSPRVLAYVSCNPDALARDLHALGSAGLVGRRGRPFRIAGVQPVDMFPHTPHVETVTVLRNDQVTAG